MRRNIYFYKSWFGPVSFKQFIPNFSFSKNVQGWFFTRNWSVVWLTYAITFSITIMSDLNENREIAHEKNVLKYLAR